MAETSWAERRGRMVKCKIHGLHFDPEMSTGCTRCMREAAKAQPKRPPQLVLILLCLLGMATILFYIFGPGQSETTKVIDLGVASNPVASVPKLDPEPYRSPFETLETALFRTPLDEAEDLLIVSGDVQAAADELSAEILEAEPVDGLTAADLIARLGQAVPIDQVVVADIERARSQWLRIRKQRFQPADWFSQPAAAGETPTASIADYSEVATSVRTLIEDGIAEVEALSEPVDTLPGRTTTRSSAGERSLATGWKSSTVSRVACRPGPMPAQPAGC